MHITRRDLVEAMYQISVDDTDSEYFLKPESWIRWRALTALRSFEVIKRFKILHDFEQNYGDLFAKYVIREMRSRKPHKKIRLERKMASWNDRDLDFVVARRAVEYARGHIRSENGPDIADALCKLPDFAKNELILMGLANKPPLNSDVIEQLCQSPNIIQAFQSYPKKIFGVGLSYYALKCLTRALDSLGFNVIQNIGFSPQVYQHNIRAPLLEDFDGVLGVDLAPHIQYLDQAYPEARFILAIGYEEAWLKEVKNDQGPTRQIVLNVLSQLTGRDANNLVNGPVEQLVQVYQICCQQIQAYFQDRPAKLLVLEMTSDAGAETSWNTLCSFLDLQTVIAPFFCVPPKWQSRLD